MRININNKWYDAIDGDVIAVELTENDRKNIANMSPDATLYAVFNPDHHDMGAVSGYLDHLKSQALPAKQT